MTFLTFREMLYFLTVTNSTSITNSIKKTPLQYCYEEYVVDMLLSNNLSSYPSLKLSHWFDNQNSIAGYRFTIVKV